MPGHMIVYSSRSLIPPAYADREIQDLVNRSIVTNGQHQISGALIYSEGRRFAQVLEGDAGPVNLIMDKIRQDARHSHIVMLYDGVIAQRRFTGWSLAYRGQRAAVDQAITTAEYQVAMPSNKALGELVGLIAQLAARP